MGTDDLGKNIVFPIYNSNGTAFHDLKLYKSSVDSVVMSLGDKITGDVYYKDNTLVVTMSEYIIFDGVKYTLVNPPVVVREGMVSDNSELKGMTKYSFTFYHPMYMLGNFPFTDVAVSSNELKYKSQDSTFTWIGTLTDYVAKLNKNLDGTEWVCEVGDTVPQEDRNKLSQVLTFDKQKISDALKTGYDEWSIPYIIDKIKSTDARYAQGKRFLVRFGLPSQEILASTNPDVPYVFRFGQGVGLKNNSRNPKNNKIVTRLAGYGSETNVPWGYPQIIWTGNQSWDYTINNDSTNPLSYPIYDGIVNGQRVRLIKHPFTRNHVMPSIYAETVNLKVNPNATGYDPDTEIKDYYDADDGTYENPIKLNEPSYEIHEFGDIKPELGESALVAVYPYDDYTKDSVTVQDIYTILDTLYSESHIVQEKTNLSAIKGLIATAVSQSGSGDVDNYVYSWSIESNADYAFLKYTSSSLNFEYTVLRSAQAPQADWNDDIDDEGNYVQGYFKVKLPVLSFDIYACAAATEEMTINMRSGACLGCSFKVQVDWDDYKRNMYDADGNFAPSGQQRDMEKYPDSSQVQVTLIVQKDTETFGTLMPNVYQKPAANDKYVILGISLPYTYVTNAESRLDDVMEQYMHENNVYYYDYPLKFDEHFLASNLNILQQIKTNTIVRFEYGGSVNALYVKQLTVRYGDSPLPKYDITLTDDVEIVLNQIGQVADEVSKIRMMMNGGSGIDTSLLDERYLSKQNDDTASGMVRLISGMSVGERFVTGLIGEGGVFRTESDGTTYLEVDKMYVRMKAYFDTVEVRRYMHSNGNRVASDAGAKISRVEYIDSNGNVTTNAANAVKFRCYFRVGEDGNTATNDWVIGDLAYCHVTNESVAQGVDQHQYWRAVVGRNTEGVLTASGEAYIDLSASDCMTGSDIPIAQDDIMQLGNKTDTTRQGAIIEYVSGADAPAYQIYQGINTYSLVGKNYVRFGYDSQSGGAQAFIGNPDGSTYLWYHNVTEGGSTFPRLDIKANVTFTSPTTHQDTTIEDFAGAVTNSIEDLQEQIDGEIDTWFYEGTPTLANLPASDWTTAAEKERHLGDMYYDIGTGATGGFAYRFIKTVSEGVTTYSWQYLDDTAITEALAKSAEAYDLADHKRRVFLTTPTPPYDAGDMWVNAVYPASGASQGSTYNNDILRCQTSKAATGSFDIADWGLASNYTDDSALIDFITNTYATDLQNLNTQIDKKAETWYQDSDPSSAWTTDALKAEHVGDIWCDTSANGGKKTWIFRDRGAGQQNRYYWAEQAVPDVVFDDIDGKCAIYVAWNAWVVDNVSKLQLKDLFIPSSDTTQGGVTYKANKVYRCINDSTPTFQEAAYTDDSAFNGYINAILNGSGASGDSATAAAAQRAIIGALGGATVVDGGLMLTSLIAMRKYNSGDKSQLSSYTTWSGISGVYNASVLGGGIAYWAGGDMKDYDLLTDTQKNNGWSVERWAKILHRFDGSGYIADHHIRWDSNGSITIDNVNQLSALSIQINNQLVATQPWVQNNFISIEFFNRLFRAYNGNTLVNANDTTSTIDNIKAMFGFWTQQYISALGQGSDGGATIQTLAQLNDVSISNVSDGQVLVYDSTSNKWKNGVGTGVDMTAVWAALAGSTNEQINASHLTTALSSYVTTTQLNALEYLNQVIGGEGFVTLKTNKNSEFVVDITHEHSWFEILDRPDTITGYGVVLTADDIPSITKSKISDFPTTWAWSAISSKPTTISGYGITDAKIDTGVITLGSNTITPVTSVELSMPTGFSISGSPVTKTGTLTVGYASGYEGFTTALKNKIEALYSWFEVDENGNVKTKDYTESGQTKHRGFWSASFVSALGQGTDGGGGGQGDVTWALLASTATGGRTIDISYITNALSNGGYATQSWVQQQGYTTNIGTVTQVKIGTTAYNPSSGIVSLPAYPSDYWKTGDSRTKNTVLAAPNGSNGAASFRALVAADIPDMSSTYATSARVTTLEGYFTNGSANNAVALKTARTLWGQSFDGTANVSGALSSVGGVSFTHANAITIDNIGNFKLNTGNTYWHIDQNDGTLVFAVNTSGNVGVGLSAPSYKLHVVGTFYASGNSSIGGTFGVTGATTLSSTLAVTGATTLTGLLTANGGIIIPSDKTLTIGDAVLSWDSTNQGIKITKGLYSQTFISALGAGSDSGGGGGQGDVTWVLLADGSDNRQIAISHLTTALSGYATETWVNNKGYLTQQSLSNYYTKSQTDSAISTALSSYATTSQLNALEFVNQITGDDEIVTFSTNKSSSFVIDFSHEHSFFELTDKPDTVAGYGIVLTADDIPSITKSKISDFPTTWAWSAISNKPTTVSGYGITDAKIESGVITLGSNTITPVTSVAMSVPTGFSVSGSPVTKTGTLALSYASGYEGFTTTLKTRINTLWDMFTREGSGTSADPYIIKANYGLYTDSFLSALGLGSDGGGGGQGDVTWALLADNSDTRQVALSHITTALGTLTGYTTSGKNYAVQKDSSNHLYVNVPWTDTTYSLPLAADGTRGGVQVGYTTSGKNYAVQLSGEKMYVNVPWTDNDTKNTAGSTNNASTKLFLIGATEQSANHQTYSNVNVYIGTDNCLYSNGTKVLVTSDARLKTVSFTADSILTFTHQNDTTSVIDFSHEHSFLELIDRPDTIDGYGITDAARASDVATLQSYFTNGIANNADKLDGNDSTYFAKASDLSTVQGYFDSNGNSKSALKLTTTSKTAWGQTFWTSGGIPDSISGNISNAGNITPSATASKNLGSDTLMFEYGYIRRLNTQSGYDLRIGAGGTQYIQINASTGAVSISSAVSMSSTLGVTGATTLTGLLTANGGVVVPSSNTIKIGNAYLSYDSTNNAIRVSANADGTGAANFYAMGAVSALGQGSDSGGGGGQGDVTWTLLASTATGGRTVDISYLSNALSTLTGYTTSGKNYKVQIDSSNHLYVNVPWSDTTYSLPLAANGTRGGVQIGYSESGQNYAVKLSSEKMYVSVPWTDTKNTAGTTNNASTKLFIVGATSQNANPQTYSNANVYIGTNNCLYSNGNQVITTSDARLKTLSLTATGIVTFTHQNDTTSIVDFSHEHSWFELIDRPDTIAGYGITDAAKASDVTTLQGYFTNGSANTAVALKTSRSIWGQSFNGSANISGAITGATTISASGNVSVGGTLGVTGATTLSSTLSVTGATTLHGDITIDSSGEPTIKFITQNVNWANIRMKSNGNLYFYQGYTTTSFAGVELGNIGVNGAATISSTLSVSGNTTISGTLSLKSDAYLGNYCLNCNNSDIVGVNSIYTADTSDDWSEGIHFKRSDGNWDTITGNGEGDFLIYKNNGSAWAGLNCGMIWVYGPTNATMTTATTNPRVVFAERSNGTNSQRVGIVYTDYDAYRDGKGLKVMDMDGEDPNVWFEVAGNFISTGAVTALSDIRHKNIIKDVDVSVEQIAKMSAVVYQWNDRKDKEMHVGSIAQDWQRILPEVVMRDGNKEGTLSMQYGVAALISSIITARKVVDHEKRIQELERENKRLKEMLNVA